MSPCHVLVETTLTFCQISLHLFFSGSGFPLESQSNMWNTVHPWILTYFSYSWRQHKKGKLKIKPCMCLIPCVLTRLYITRLCLLSFGGYISNAAGHLVSAPRVSDAQVINHSTARGTLRPQEALCCLKCRTGDYKKGQGLFFFFLMPSRKPRWCGNNFLGVNDVYLKLLLVIHQAATGRLYSQISQVKGQPWKM